MDAKEAQTAEAAEDKAQATAAEEETSSDSEVKEQAETQDNLSDEAKLAAEALEATDEPAGDAPEIEGLKGEKDKLTNEVTALRAERRSLRRFKSELDKQISDKMAAEKAASPPEKSPEEKYIEENADTFDPDTEPFPAKVQIAQRKWEKEQAEKTNTRQQEEAIRTRANNSYLKARDKYSDFDQVLEDAQDLLTEGDQLDFRRALEKGDDAGDLIYRRCIYKTLEAGGDRARQLRARLKQKTKASVQKPKQKPTDGSQQTEDKKPEEKPSETSAEETVDNPQLAQVYSAFGID